MQDHEADLVIHGYVDDVMEKVMEILGIPVPSPAGPQPIQTGTETGIT